MCLRWIEKEKSKENECQGDRIGYMNIEKELGIRNGQENRSNKEKMQNIEL